MRFVTADFETYYDDQYSLTKMSQEDYVNDPRFEIIMVGLKIGDDPAYWITGTHEEIGAHLYQLQLQGCIVLAHNMSFDGLILAVIFGIFCGLYADTRLLAQAVLKPHMRSVSLDNCMKQINLGIQKGTEVHNMKGRTRLSLSKEEMARYGDYCCTDCEAEYRLFKYLAPQFPRSELEVIDLTLRMYLQPTLELNTTLMAECLGEARAKKQQLLNSLPAGVTQEHLMSNPKLAEVLQTYGITPPIKLSPTTGKVTWAFAKTDTAWKELEEEHAGDPEVSAILAARIGAKSTLEESRYVRLLNIGNRYPKFRVPILYHAAHTGRDGGTEGINAQNFPRVDKSRMRFGIVAPKGHVVLAADLAQIEARITALLAGQQNLLTGFRNKEDVYSSFASTAYQCETIKGRSKEDNKRRFVGKTCVLGLGFGMAAIRLRATLRKDGVILSLEECEALVNAYRKTLYPRIPSMWRQLDQYLPLMAANAGKIQFGPVTLVKDAIVMPDGMSLIYNRLRKIETDKYSGYVYNFAGETRTLWGGKLTENIVQKLARILIMGYMRQIRHMIGIIPALRQHDELDYVVPLKYADKIAAVIGKIMRVPPSWAPDLPVEVEINYGPTLGDCK